MVDVRRDDREARHRSGPKRGYRRRGRRRGKWAHTYAALDLGTNNCRLLVARPRGRGFEVVDSFSRIVRLGEGVSLSGVLSDSAIARTLPALSVCADKIRRRRVSRWRCVATEACRRAGNRQEFVDRVMAETGLDIEVISTDEEAQLALDGCAALLDGDKPWALIIDIGGGSTELMWVRLEAGRRRVLVGGASLNFGVISLTERYGGGNGGATDYQAIIEHVGALLQDFEDRHGIAGRIADGRVQMLGTSGTVTTVAGVYHELPRYDRSRIDGSYVGLDAIHDVCNRLSAMDYAERVAQPCIGEDRADVVVAGCAILDAICRMWPVHRLRVADRGLREGILLSLMADADTEAARAVC